MRYYHRISENTWVSGDAEKTASGCGCGLFALVVVGVVGGVLLALFQGVAQGNPAAIAILMGVTVLPLGGYIAYKVVKEQKRQAFNRATAARIAARPKVVFACYLAGCETPGAVRCRTCDCLYCETHVAKTRRVDGVVGGTERRGLCIRCAPDLFPGVGV